jgi:hypothetical protein
MKLTVLRLAPLYSCFIYARNEPIHGVTLSSSDKTLERYKLKKIYDI